MTRVHVLGAGAFGRALATALTKAGKPVALHGRGARPDTGAGDIVLLVVPAAQTETVLTETPLSPEAVLVACAKGIVASDLQTDIIARHHAGPVAVLSGPGFADEIARGLPTALTLACVDPGIGAWVQSRLATPSLRLYHSDDVIGAQVGGALKNVSAIACGAAVGANLGESARAALMTRGFAEVVRVGLALGARERTFAGLSGLGDLALSCTSTRSRNFAAGVSLARTGQLPQGTTIEGVGTARAALSLATGHGIDMPVTAGVNALLDGRARVSDVVEALLSRPLKPE